jgi:tetratricopeptide (TPR) repeat protein
VALRAEPAIAGLTDGLVGLKETEWNLALSRLVDIDLLSRSGTGSDAAIDAHPLVREYFAEQLAEQSPEAFRDAHSRLFNHLCKTTPNRPDHLFGLAPLYQAVVHGCLAGRHQEACDNVYQDRILQGTGPGGNYSSFKLGAIGANLGAIASFFDELWTRVSPNLCAPAQAWILNEAAFCLRSLGRLTEGVAPLRVGLEHQINSQEWKQASIYAGNLSELQLTLGQLNQALAESRRAVEFADMSAHAFQKMAIRCTAADALHLAGRRKEAEALFVDAEQIQKEDQPEFPILYSLAGFRFVDFILAPVERAAWQRVLRCTGIESAAPVNSGGQSDSLAVCAEAECRSTQTLAWAAPRNLLLDVALDHLSTVRARLFRWLLSSNSKSDTSTLRANTAMALAKLREANSQDRLPKALLTAALYFGAVENQPDEAHRYLNEVQQIAERGPMPLYLADVHLHRGRLFRDRTELAKARALIEKHGYWRRKEELEDAEALI